MTDTQLIEVVNPYDRTRICEVEALSWDALDAALDEAAHLHKANNHPLSVRERCALLLQVANRIEDEKEDYARLMAREGGKPYSDSMVEVERAIDGIRYTAEHTPAFMEGEVVPMRRTAKGEGKLARTVREPIGPVLAYSAFNHPLNLIVHQIVPAIAAGCPVLVKPAKATPLTCFKLVEALHEAGLPEAWCKAFVCDREARDKLVRDARVAHFSFIGSADVGWKLRSQLAAGTRCSLEHGGSAPVILLPDADMDAAIAPLVKGAMYHAGQVCVSVQRVYVPWAEAANVARALAEAVDELRVSNPEKASTDVGPLINPGEVERISDWVDEAVHAGAKLIKGGKALGETQYEPTVLLDAPDDAKVTRDELFGPVVCVYGYDDVEDAVTRANATPWAFQAAVWGRNEAEVNKVVRGLDAATVMVNDMPTFRVDWMPFGGRRHSGLGLGGIPYELEANTCHKLVIR